MLAQTVSIFVMCVWAGAPSSSRGSKQYPTLRPLGDEWIHLAAQLQAEGASVQDIKDQTKLGYGLHLLQTSADSIGAIAELCGYQSQSQSRFSERFKQRFGLTPTELRKTKWRKTELRETGLQ